jgi:hypothetical protein
MSRGLHTYEPLAVLHSPFSDLNCNTNLPHSLQHYTHAVAFQTLRQESCYISLRIHALVVLKAMKLGSGLFLSIGLPTVRDHDQLTHETGNTHYAAQPVKCSPHKERALTRVRNVDR